MNRKKINIIISISALALVGLIILQINWVRHAAALREEQIKHRISMAAHKTWRRINRNEPLKQAIAQGLYLPKPDAFTFELKPEVRAQVDSLIQAQFEYYHVDLAYEFQFINKQSPDFTADCSKDTNLQRLCLDGFMPEHHSELRISFADTKPYVYAKMGSMMLASAFLVGLVALCFYITIATIWRQKRLSEMTSDFINNMTHELKTPISTVALASNMLRRQKLAQRPEKVQHYAGIIHDENEKLQQQVEQVLRIARIERGEFKLNKTEADVHELIQSAIKSIDLQVREKNGQIQCYLNALKGRVIADTTHLTNVFANLLDNANKYSTSPPKITVMTQDREDGILISIADEGIGMSKDKQRYIFDKFYRVSTGNLHDVKGFGLGLSYVKTMVEAHKGYVSLQSELGKGSRFDIFLPN